jgi:hypothetical protein
MYARVRRAVQVDGMSERQAAREFGLSRQDDPQDAGLRGAAGVSAQAAGGAAEAGAVAGRGGPDSGR